MVHKRRIPPETLNRWRKFVARDDKIKIHRTQNIHIDKVHRAFKLGLGNQETIDAIDNYFSLCKMNYK
jgi:hypothetical protein